MSDWSCRQREARSHLRLFHLVLGSHDGRALVPIPKRSAYPASDLDVVVVDSLKALDPNRPIREVGHRLKTAVDPDPDIQFGQMVTTLALTELVTLASAGCR